MQDQMETDSDTSAETSGNDLDTGINWHRIGDITWQDIFARLDGVSLLKVSETCKYFQELASSTKLLKNIKAVIQFPDRIDENLAELERRLLKCSTRLTRPYQNLEIIRLRNGYLADDNPMRSKFFSSIRKMAPSLKSLKVVNCHILRKDLVLILLPCKHLQECSFKNLMLFDHVATNEGLPNLSCQNIKKLEFSECDFYCLLMFKEFNKLVYLEITNPAYSRTDVELLENFLMRQGNLKELIMKDFRFNSTYSTGRLASVPFQLESLSLHNVNWDISNHCEAFLKSQRSLRKLKLSRFNRWTTPWASNHIWVMGVMGHFFTQNPKLTSVTIETNCGSFKDFKDAEFLPGITCNTVEELTYLKNREDKSELLKIFTRIFPNVKTFSFTAASGDTSDILQLQQFKLLESLKLQLSPKSFASFQLGTKTLKTFQYCATNEEKSLEKLAEFFNQNATIQHVSLNMEPLTIEEITEMLLPLTPTLESITISDLHLNTTEAELFAANFPRLHQIQSDFPLAPEIVTTLKNSNISFKAVQDDFLFKREEVIDPV